MIKKTLFSALCAAFLTLCAMGLNLTQEEGQKKDPAAAEAEKAKAAVIESQSPSYPLNTCVVSGEAFTAESPAVDVVVQGRLLRTCCTRCAKKVEQDPKAAIAKVDKAVIEQQKSLWPLKACPISGDAYGGDMGEPIDYVLGTRYVKLCCKGCLRGVTKEPAKFIEKLDALVMPELAKTYPTELCVVSQERLGSMGDPIDVMYGHRLLRFCCKGCIRAYKKDPAKLVRQVYAAKSAEKTK